MLTECSSHVNFVHLKLSSEQSLSADQTERQHGGGLLQVQHQQQQQQQHHLSNNHFNLPQLLKMSHLPDRRHRALHKVTLGQVISVFLAPN